MQDQATIARVSLLHPMFIPIITAFINEIEQSTGLIWRIVQGFRSFDEQNALYKQGRTVPGKIVTYSIGGASWHNYGLAADTAPLNPDGSINEYYNYAKLRPAAQLYGLQMGLDFPHADPDHFEKTFGMNWREALHRYTTRDFIPDTQFINI